MCPPLPEEKPEAAQTFSLFPTIIRRQEFGDGPHNEALFKLIKQWQADPAIDNALLKRPVATVGGYQPDVILHERLAGTPLWTSLTRQIVHPAISGYLAEHHRLAGWPGPPAAYTFNASWAVLYPSGAYQAAHTHGNIFCVLAYYVRVPARQKPEGVITFVNPHPESGYSATRAWDYHASFMPKAGTAIVFPGWLQHYSHPHFSADERLLLTFDVSLVAADQ